jgi:protein-arginine kinase/protein-arginine kinase activator protein McsA
VICAECGEHEAVVHLGRHSRGPVGEPGELALCAACARSRGIVASGGTIELKLEELLSAGVGRAFATGGGAEASLAECPSCGTRLADFKREGRLGCFGCLEAFRPELSRVLRGRDHRGARSAGPELARNAPDAAAPPSTPPESLRERLRQAVEREDYEAAAAFRDELSRGEGGVPTERRPVDRLPDRGAEISSNACPPLGSPAFGRFGSGGAVISSAFRVSRNLADLPFPGSPRGGGSPSRHLWEERFASLDGWRSAGMSQLGSPCRRSLSERGLVPRSYCADPQAVLRWSSAEPLYALTDQVDHLRMHCRTGGLSLRRAHESAAALAASLERPTGGSGREYAHDAGLGWICSRLGDCGAALSASILVHIPALAWTGFHEKVFRALMADNIGVNGMYPNREGSAGAVYELVVDASAASSADEACSLLEAGARAIEAAEARAREALAASDRDSILDAAGRAWGVIGHCLRLSLSEAQDFLSALRLASQAGLWERTDLEPLLDCLGPGSLALEFGLASLPNGEAADSLRARLLRRRIIGAEEPLDGGRRCSRD